MTRTWNLPSEEAVSAYASAVLTSPTSLLPGLSALEAEAAHSYVRALPMRRDESITETWGALSPATRDWWIGQTRSRVAAAVDMPVSEVLDLAANLIEVDGWTQGQYRGDNGEHCVMDAIRVVCGVPDFTSLHTHPDGWPALIGLTDFLDRSPASWNDDLGRTAHEVIATLRAASAAHATREAPVTLTGAVAK